MTNLDLGGASASPSVGVEPTLVRVAPGCKVRVQATMGTAWAGAGTIVRDLPTPEARTLVAEGFVEPVSAAPELEEERCAP